MAEGRQQILTELHNAPEAFSNAMVEQLAPSLDKLNETVEELREQKEESSADAIGQLIAQFQDSLSTSTVTQMEELAKTVGNASQSLVNLPNLMEQMIAGVQQQLNQTRQLLAETSETQTEQMRNMMGEMLNTFQGTIHTQQAGLSETTDTMNEQMKQVASEIRNLLESAANQADEQLGQRMADMESVSEKSIQALQSAIAELRQSITSTLNQQQQTIGAITSQTAKVSAEATDQMQKLVYQAATRLGESVQGAEQSINTLLQQQGNQIETFYAQITNSQAILTSSREILEQMNTSVTSVRQLIETTRALSGRLMNGTAQLESAGQHLTKASEVFNRENERYLAANRETTEQIQTAVGHLNDSVQRFQTIDNGLQGIFAEIEKGLNTYATTSRESINQYLSDFSDQLAQASRALSGSVEALTDIVEDVTDTNERLARRGSNR